MSIDSTSINSTPLLVHQTVIKPSPRWAALDLKAVWQYRELLYFLVWRDIKVRYKQTALGVAWIILQPVISITIFSFLFGVLLKAPSEGVPYPIFAYAALLPWNYFAGALSKSSISLINNANLITKVYFPRLVVPISSVLSGLVDFAISFLVLIGLMIFYRVNPTPALLLLPFFVLLAVLNALGFGLWLSALNVQYRDVNHLVPFIIQVWMYITPVLYSASLIPERYRFLLTIDPMTGVVDGFRWALLGSRFQDIGINSPIFYLSLLVTLVVLISGAVFFRHTEKSYADII